MKRTRKRKPVKRSAAPGKRGATRVEVHPLTPERWDDFETLFGARGACGGCWCMWWRLARSEFERRKGAGNRRAMRALVRSGRVPGLLAYRGGEPVGWISVAPREEFPSLGRSRILKPVDDRPVWSVVCFFVRRDQRRSGLSLRLLKAAVDHVRRSGGRIVEGYPVEPRKADAPDLFLFHGLRTVFDRAGFREVARRSETRPIMRRGVRPAVPPARRSSGA